MRGDREQLHPVRPRQPLQHLLDPGAVGSRAGGDAYARELEDALRLLPREEVRELVGADQEERVVEGERRQRVDRATERVERDLGLAEAARTRARPGAA